MPSSDTPAWPVVQPARPAVIRPVNKTPKRRKSGWKTAFILPDPQFGARVDDDGVVHTFHDPKALDVALRLMSVVQADTGIDVVVNLGDFLDLPSFGKYIQEPGFAQTTQLAVDEGYEFLCKQKAEAPDAEFYLLSGNHDDRITQHVLRNSLASFGLKQAAKPDSWPVLSVPNLLRLDELGVEWVPYSAGQVWLTDHIRCIHGTKVRSSGSTAQAVTQGEMVSTIFGHVHRIETQYRTLKTRNGPHRIFATTPGCLCRVDGTVPSYHSTTDAQGRPVTHWEDWQQGVLVLHYSDNGFQYSLEMVEINDGWAMFRGQEVVSSL